MTRSVIHLLGAGFGVDGKQIIHPLHDARRHSILRMQLHRIDELPPRMRPAHSMHHLRPADVLVSGIAVGLQDAIELSFITINGLFLSFGEDELGSSEMAQNSVSAAKALNWRPSKTRAFNNRLEAPASVEQCHQMCG